MRDVMAPSESRKLSVVVIVNTPFDADGQVDEQSFRRQLRRLNLPQIEVYVAGSGSSEGYSLSAGERELLLNVAVEELKGKIPVRAMGCEPHTYAEMLSFMKAAEAAGVDAAQIFSLDIGHGAQPTFAEMERYYRTIIESTSLPIYLSSHRSAGYNLPMALVEQLVDRYPSIAGINYSGPEVSHLAELVARLNDRIEVHCAGPANALSTLGLGGNGFMGGEGNLSPEMVAAVIAGYQSGDLAATQVAFNRLMRFAGIYGRFGGSTMRGMKPLMNTYGLPGGSLRLPRLPITEAELDEMIRLVEPLDIPGLPKRARRNAPVET